MIVPNLAASVLALPALAAVLIAPHPAAGADAPLKVPPREASGAEHEGIDDQAISDQVADELDRDPGINAGRIEVSTEDGIVTLIGRVGNVLARQRASDRAELVRGVRSVVNRVRVRPAAALQDHEIRTLVEEAFRDDPATEDYEIVVSVDDGVVTLEGRVDSQRERDLARLVAQGVRGVVSVVDELAVRTSDRRADEELQAEISESLRWNARIDGNLVRVSVADGKVSLAGTVGSASEKTVAEALAWVSGVRAVDTSDLEVGLWQRDPKLRGDKYRAMPAPEIQRALRDAFRADPRVNAEHVVAQVEGSTVTLRGRVETLKAKRAAERAASHTVGVTIVRNRLHVESDGAGSDKEIEKRIRRAIERDPYLDRFEIRVDVLDGTVLLYGTVDTRFEKNRVDDAAARIRGAVAVRNYIQVEDDSPYLYNPYVDHAWLGEDPWIATSRRRPLANDLQIRMNVLEELRWSPFVNSKDVTVSVDDGVVVLTGTVGSWAEWRAATANGYEGGATLVRNELRVTNP